MNSLSKLVETLQANRFSIAIAVVVGLVIVGSLIAFVPSHVGFVLAGPLVFFPWGLLCIAFARRPFAPMVIFFVIFSLGGLAWPLLYI